MSKPNIVEFYEHEVLPIVMASAPAIFPEFDFQRHRKGWQAGKNASQEVIDFFNARAERIIMLNSRPGLLSVADGQGYQLTQWVLRSLSKVKGADFKKAVVEIANLAGVDTSPIDGTKLTDQERADIDARREQQKAAAKVKREADELKRKNDDAQAIKYARNYIAKARHETNEHGQQLAVDYFGTRGLKVAQHTTGLVGELSASILCVKNAGIPGSNASAVIFPMIDQDDHPTSLQRVFVDAKGRKVTVEIDGSQVGKATLGRPVGGYHPTGFRYHRGVCVVVEGAETGYAIFMATGFDAACGISAHGMEEINLRRADVDRKRIHMIIVAGDLDRSDRGQDATATTGDRLRREYGIPVVELLPTREMTDLVGEDGYPRDGAKSVDFDDVRKAIGDEKLADIFDDAITRATVKLQHQPDSDTETTDDVDGSIAVDEGQPTQSGKVPPVPKLLMPENELDRAHEYIKSRHLPEDYNATTLMEMSGRLYRYEPGVWIELGEPKVIRGDIRRWARPYKIVKKTREAEPRPLYPLLNISKAQIDAVQAAVIDEVSVIVHQDDFRTQFWTAPNILSSGEFDTKTPSWARRIEDNPKAGRPEPEMILSLDDGLLNLDEWLEHQDLDLIPHTPEFFTLSKIDISLPVEQAGEALKGGIEGLREFAYTLCPEYIKFLEGTFHDDEDETAAPVTIRELHKVIGYYLTEDLTHHQANIAWFHGPAGTGKSTLKNVICELLGKRNVVSSNMHKITQQFHLASWIGRRLAVFADLDQGSRSDKTNNVEIFKMIATGDAMSIDRKHRDEIPNHVMKTRLLCLVNQMPHMPDPSNSLLRRSICFDFKRIPPKSSLDPNLEEKMTTPESLAGILLLAIVGLADLKSDGGFIQPESSAEPLEQLAEQSSDYPEFIEQCIEVTNERGYDGDKFIGDHLAAEDLYAAFCGYLTSMGTKHHPKRHRMLSELIPVLTTHKWIKTKQCSVMSGGTQSPKGYRGLKLTDTGLAFAVAERGEKDGDHSDQSDSEGFIKATS